MRDKAKLKSEVKKYSTELRNMTSEHQDELERNQEYFQEQIYSITEERDNFSDQLLKSKESLFRDKERLRTEFSKKFATEKKRLETRYADRNSKQYSRLNSAIESLQSNLNEKVEENEMLKNDFEFQLAENEDMYRKQIDELSEQLIKSKQSVEDERVEMRKMILRYNNEKEVFKRNCIGDKEREIEKIIIDNRMAGKAFEQVKRDLEDKVMYIEKEHKEAMMEQNEQLVRLKNHHAQQLEHQKNMLSGKVDNALREFNEEKEKYMSVMEDEIKDLKLHYETLLETQRIENNKNINVLKEAAEKEKSMYDNSEKKIVEESIEKENKLKVFFENKLNDIQTEKTETEKKFADLEKINENLTTQTKYYREAMNRMRDDTTGIKNKFLENLNRQTELNDTALKERDSHISELENNLKSVHEQCSEKLLKAKMKMEDIESDNKVKAARIYEMEKYLKQELEERSKDNENYKSQIYTLKIEKDDLIKNSTSKLNMQYSTFTKELESLRLEIGEKDKNIISKTKEIETLTELLNKVNTKNNNFILEIERLKTELNKKSQDN